MRRFVLGLLTLLVCSPARAREFSPEQFPVQSPLEAKFRQARSLEEAGDARAADLYRQLLRERRFPLPDAIHWALGRLSSLEEAEPHWRAVLSAEPPSPFARDAMRGLVDVTLSQGRLGEAEQWLRRLAEASRGEKQRAAALAGLLPLLYLEGKEDELARTAKMLWVDHAALPEAKTGEAYLDAPYEGATPEELLRRGLKLLNGGSRVDAVKTLTELRARLPAESPLEPEVDLALGKALFFLRRYDEALACLAGARSDPRRQEEARYYRARALFGLNRGDEGAADLADLARPRPRSSKGADYLNQAYRVFEGRGERRRASRALNLLLKRYPRSAEGREARWAQGWRAFREARYVEAAERFWTSVQGAASDWQRAQGLYWEARSLVAAGEQERGRGLLEALQREFPLGYYSRLARAFLEDGRGDLGLADPRQVRGTDLPLLAPKAGEVSGQSLRAEAERAAAYLRLGLPDAAREVLRAAASASVREPARARLLYWAEDFHGALSASGRTWLDWPVARDPDPLDPAGLAYPLAYPRSVSEAAREAGIHPHLVLAIAHTESHFDPRVYSSAEARGLMQFIPSTGAAVAKGAGIASLQMEQLYDPKTALRLGARHLRELLDRFEGDAVLAAAAYNAGAAAVARWKAEFPGLDGSAFVESIPYRETRQYVKKVLTALDAYGRLDPPGLWRAQTP